MFHWYRVGSIGVEARCYLEASGRRVLGEEGVSEENLGAIFQTRGTRFLPSAL